MQTSYTNYFRLKTISKWIFLLLFVFGINIVRAQESGRIAGTVLDKNTTDPLPGANVFLEGTSLGAATTIEGKYIIRQVIKNRRYQLP
jgi:CarboxypepD_reg-like domain